MEAVLVVEVVEVGPLLIYECNVFFSALVALSMV